ncbi:MAG: chemotaxis protein CheD [Gemmatimonadaceae bacterium]
MSGQPPREVRVKVADLATGDACTRLATIGLGSCVAIALHDPAAGVGGLAHILLPNESLSRDTSNPAKFPATAIPVLVAELRRLGSRGASAMTARIAGGASMFSQLLPAGGVNMGERNVDATHRALQSAGIRVVGQDTGGDYGRSVYFDVGTGRVLVKSLKRGDLVL